MLIVFAVCVNQANLANPAGESVDDWLARFVVRNGESLELAGAAGWPVGSTNAGFPGGVDWELCRR